MLTKRVIPCLDVTAGRVVKGTRFLSLRDAYLELRPEIEAAFHRVMESGWYVLGREVEAFEREFVNVLKEFKSASLKIKMKNLTTEMVLAEHRKDRLKLVRLNL